MYTQSGNPTPACYDQKGKWVQNVEPCPVGSTWKNGQDYKSSLNCQKKTKVWNCALDKTQGDVECSWVGPSGVAKTGTVTDEATGKSINTTVLPDAWMINHVIAQHVHDKGTAQDLGNKLGWLW